MLTPRVWVSFAPRPRASRPTAARIAPGHGAHERGDDPGHHVGHDLLEDQPPRPDAVGPRDLHVRPFAERQHLRADDARREHPGHDGHRQRHRLHAHLVHVGGDDDEDGEHGHGQQRVRDDPDDGVRPAAHEARDQPSTRPTPTPTMPAMRPILSEFGVPRTRSVHRSRPCVSVPRKCSQQGGRRGPTGSDDGRLGVRPGTAR